MSVLLWIVFGWLVLGTLVGAVRSFASNDEVDIAAGLLAFVINVGCCIVVAFAAVGW